METTTFQAAPERVEYPLLNAAIRFNIGLLGLVGGLLGAVFMIAGTMLSLAFGGPDPGHYLSLLAIFLPGYRVDLTGLLIGAGWGFVYGGLSGMLIYWSYARVLGEKLTRQVIEPSDSDLILKPVTLTLPGWPLGIAVGGLMALQLLITTNWLVLRGTAEHSVHAALLANYLPGYSVSPMGSVIGALELFAVTCLSCLLIAAVYNRITRLRHGE